MKKTPVVLTTRLIILLLIAIVSIVYWKVGYYPFVNFDDDLHITDNRVVLKGLTWPGIKWAFQSFYPNWHPLTWISHMADVELFGKNAGFHHLVNVLIHALTTLILFLTLRRATRAIWKSAFVAACFAVHPLHVESVVWISERKEVLCGFFWVLTIFAYTLYVDLGGIRRYLFVLMFFVLGLLSKPMIVTLPFVLMLLDYWPLNRVSPATGEGGEMKEGAENGASSRRLFWEKLPLLFLMLCISVATYIAQFRGGYVSDYPLRARISNATVSLVAYLSKLIWPASLAIYYPHPWLDRAVIPAWKLGGSLFLLAAITFLVILWVRRRPYLPVGWFWFFGTLIPVIGIIQVGNQAMADRYAYIPSIGVFIMIAWGVPDLIRGRGIRRYVFGSLGIAYLAVLMAMATSQISHWRSSVSLYEHAVEIVPNHWRINVNLGHSLLEEDRVDEAIAKFQTMLLVIPRHKEALAYRALAMNGLAMASERQKRYEEAMEQYLEALRIYPELVVANNNLGEILTKQGRHREAVFYFQQAAKHSPTSAVVHQNLARSLAALRMTDEGDDRLRPYFPLKGR